MCKNTSSFLAVSFVVLMSNMTLSFFHQTMNFFQLIICLWLCLICGLTTCSSSGLDSGLNIPFPTEIYRQQEIILNCLQIGSISKISFKLTSGPSSSSVSTLSTKTCSITSSHEKRYLLAALFFCKTPGVTAVTKWRLFLDSWLGVCSGIAICLIKCIITDLIIYTKNYSILIGWQRSAVFL